MIASSGYRAPLAHIELTLRAVRTLAGASPGASAPPDLEESADVLEHAARFAEDVLAPLDAPGDREGTRLVDGNVLCPPGWAQAYRRFCEDGWHQVFHETEQGGAGLPEGVRTAVFEIMCGANLSFAMCLAAARGGVDVLAAHADAELAARYVPRLVSGEWAATMCMTESGAGSDLSGIRTQAEPWGDAYRLRGQKIFISWGDHDLTEEILHFVLARLPDAPAGSRGLSLFAVPKYLTDETGSRRANDVRVVSLEHKLGLRASPTCVMSFGERDGAVGHLIGQPHTGLACMFTMMNHMRLSVGVQGVAVAEHALQQAKAYAHERIQGRLPGREAPVAIAEHADVRRMLRTMEALVGAARALTLYAADELDRARGCAQARARLGLLTPIVKAWCTEIAQEVAALALQVHGGAGYIEETGVAQRLRDARIMTIYEGTNAIQAQDLLGRKILRAADGAFVGLLEEIAAWSTHHASDLEPVLRDALEQTLAQTRAALGAAQRHGAHVQAVGSVAWDFLMLTGYTLGTWMQALLSLQSPAPVPGDVPAAARFWAERIAPRAALHATAVASGPAALGLQPG